MSYDYSENILVQESAGNLLRDELGWDVKLAYNTEVLGKEGTLGRTSYKEILLQRYFREALKKLNPWINDTQIFEAQDILEHRLSSSTLLQINEEKYFLIRDGIPVTVKKPNGKTEIKKATVIDFQNTDNNYFLAVKEMKIHGDLYRRRTDIVGFINGIPLLFIELKKSTVDVQDAYTDNYTDYQDTIPHLFYYNAFLMLSNGTEAKVGTLGSKYEFFHEWKRLAEEDQGSVALETMLRGICKKENFLDLFENFILYDHSSGHTVKILARNHQYLGVNEAVRAYEARKLNNGKLGVFWHTQGSGKSYSMVFLAQKIRRKFSGSPTIVVLTDREELNTQISDTFENCGMLGKTKSSQFIASSGEDLITKLKGNPSFIFTLIQKFNKAFCGSAAGIHHRPERKNSNSRHFANPNGARRNPHRSHLCMAHSPGGIRLAHKNRIRDRRTHLVRHGLRKRDRQCRKIQPAPCGAKKSAVHGNCTNCYAGELHRLVRHTGGRGSRENRREGAAGCGSGDCKRSGGTEISGTSQ